ncbi:MAG: TolC family protein [Candidatus Aminicenantes bacterium]|nr:TolC family protein [Candidatus Aminicenantes bacterium]
MKKLIVCLSIIFGLAAAVRGLAQTPQPRTLTLAEAVRTVLARNNSLKEAEDTMAVFEARVGQSKTRLMPNVRADLAYTRIAPTEEIDIPGFGVFQLFPANNYDFHAGVNQLVYDFNRTKETVNLSRSQVESAADRWEILKRDLAFQTCQLFHSIVFLQDTIRVQTETIKTLDDHLAVARKKLEAGTATELEVLNTQVRLVTAQNQVVDLNDALEKQMLGLRRLMGIEDQTPLELQGGFKYEPQALDPEGLVREAEQTRLETKAVQDVIRSADIQIRLAELSDRPSLSVNVLAGWKSGYIPNLNVWKLNYVAAVQANVPIFNGHLARSMKAEAEANLRTLRDRNKDVEGMIRMEVLQAAADVKAAAQKLESVEINVVRAKKASEYAKSRYEAGTVTNLDLLDTEDAYAQAELVRLQALYQFVLSKLTLQRAVGNPLSE